MKALLKKEIFLSMHPTALIFLSFSFMLLIPNYPYYIIFFYTGLAIFFTCMNGRENHDVFYSVTLPIAKKEVVRGRFTFVILLEVLQLVLSIPFAIIRQSMPLAGNQVGMDANIAFFGLSLVMMGVFNLIFFGIYYKNVTKVGKAFVWASTIYFILMIIAEACAHVVVFVRDYLDTKDTEYILYKIGVLFAGLILYVLLTAIAYFQSVRNFKKLDL